MLKVISNLLKDLFKRSPIEAAEPYIPKPPEQESLNHSPSDSLLYQEETINQQHIFGTSIAFGEKGLVIVDQSNHSTDLRQTPSYILGSGRRVSHMEPTLVAGQIMPGVSGICHFCRQEALIALQANLITVPEAELKSLCDTESASHCDGCGRRDLCSRHSRPFTTDDGQQLLLCGDCAKAAQRQQWMQKLINILLLPFVEDKNTLPPKSGE